MSRRYQKILTVLSFIVITTACGQKNDAAPEASPKAAAGGKPQILAEAPDYDFGRAKQGAEVSHIYKIKNVGTKELVIEKTHGS